MSTDHESMPPRVGLVSFARRHVGQLAVGLGFTCVLVGSRLALPLPLRAVVDHSTAAGVRPTLGGWTDPVVVWSLGFVALALLAGMAEHYQRLAFAHFAGRTVSDVRGAAVGRVKRRHEEESAERVATVMADSARVKQGLKGVLNHITVNALLVLGACVVLALTDLRLGLVQLAGVGVLVLVAVLGAGRVAAAATAYREGESRVAGSVQRYLSGTETVQTVPDLGSLRDVDAASGEGDTGMTVWEGRTTCLVHVVLAVSGAAVLVLGARAAASGALSPGVLFSVMGYLLVLHGPAVRLARQVTRIAPLLVSARHLAQVLDGGAGD